MPPHVPPTRSHPPLLAGNHVGTPCTRSSQDSAHACTCLQIEQGTSPQAHIGKQLRALRAHVLVLTMLGRATVNLPPISSHWQYWKGSTAVEHLGWVRVVVCAAWLSCARLICNACGTKFPLAAFQGLLGSGTGRVGENQCVHCSVVLFHNAIDGAGACKQRQFAPPKH